MGERAEWQVAADHRPTPAGPRYQEEAMAAVGPKSLRGPVAAAAPGAWCPNRNVSGGNINRSQAAAKIKSPTKGTGTGLPSVAQGKKPGAGAGGNKGFPDVAGKPAAASRGQGAGR